MKLYKLECLNEDGDIEDNGYFLSKENAEKEKAERDLQPCYVKYSIKQHIVEIETEDNPRALGKEDLWDAWWVSACKVVSFSGVDKDYERRCFEEYYERKVQEPNPMTQHP